MNRFVPNRNLERDLKRDLRYRAMLRDAGEKVKSRAKSLARAHEMTGDYIESIDVTDSPDGVTVGTDDFAGHIIEWGSVNQPPQAPLRRGVRAAGLRFDEQSK